ncbi:MAG: hypothetical protein ABH956_03330 [Candidatus Nealsonbacteria bacterium]
MLKITKKDIQKINHFRNLFPKEINIGLHLCEDEGNYTIKILEFPNAITQAENLDDLITMVSDCVATILDIPQKYLHYMPRYLPSISLAQYMNAFPKNKIMEKGELLIEEKCCLK